MDLVKAYLYYSSNQASTHIKRTRCSQHITKWAWTPRATLQREWDHGFQKQPDWKWEEYSPNMHHYSWEIRSWGHWTQSFEKELQTTLCLEKDCNSSMPRRYSTAVHLNCIQAEIERELNHNLWTPGERGFWEQMVLCSSRGKRP